jgi:hypothetical protein
MKSISAGCRMSVMPAVDRCNPSLLRANTASGAPSLQGNAGSGGSPSSLSGTHTHLPNTPPGLKYSANGNASTCSGSYSSTTEATIALNSSALRRLDR